MKIVSVFIVCDQDKLKARGNPRLHEVGRVLVCPNVRESL